MLAIKSMRRWAAVVLVAAAMPHALGEPTHAQSARRRVEGAQPTPASVGLSAERLERMHAAMKGFVDRKEVSGVVTLVAREGKTVDLYAVGQADIDKNVPMKTDAIFRIASMSKPITSVAIMMLFEENKLFLTDPVSKFIPAFKNVQVFEPDLLKRLPCKCMISAWLSKPSPSTWKPTRPCRATSEAASRSRMSSRSGSALR